MTSKRRDVWMTGLLVCLVVAVGIDPSPVAARRPPPPVAAEVAPVVPPVSPTASVTFGAVDASTVRVFAVQNVAVERVSARHSTRIVALPNMGHGTGFAVPGDDSLVLTAAHVVEHAAYVVVRLPGDGSFYAARVAYRDEDRDVAVLQIGGAIPPIELQPATHTLRTRQPVFAVGYPLDASRRQAQSSRGIVGGLLDNGYVQLDMSVNPGNSGGPIIDDADRVVGMVVARGDVERGVQGLAFAVPLATLHDALEQARARLRDGRVPVLPSDADRAAHVIDTLSRVGFTRVMREASDVTEGTADTQTIAAVRALNVPELSPDMQVFVAAFLWDAAQMLMYRAGNVTNPVSLPRGATRTLTEELLNEATALLRSAAQRDPTVADRSPFVSAVVVRRGPASTSAASRGSQRRHLADREVPGPAATPVTRRHAQEAWAFVGGLGLGASGFLGRTEASGFGGSSPLMPGAAVRVFIGLQLSPLPALVLSLEVDMLAALGARTSGGSSPSSDDLVDNTPNSLGGGVTAVLRFFPGPLRCVFFGGLVRVGTQRFERDYGSETANERFLVVQPGFEAGIRLGAVDLALRGNLGIPGSGARAELYTVLLNVGVRFADLRRAAQN